MLFLGWLFEMTQVKKVYRRALRIGKKILSRQISLEEIESFLLKKGLKKKDIKASISLASCLLYFHKLVFPEEEIKIFFCYNEPNSENIASNGKKIIKSHLKVYIIPSRN